MFGVSFHLFTNHKRLKYIFTQNLNNQQRRWLRFFGDYDINIVYHPGKENVVADALSGRPVLYGARLSTMGIRCKDQREEVAIDTL